MGIGTAMSVRFVTVVATLLANAGSDAQDGSKAVFVGGGTALVFGVIGAFIGGAQSEGSERIQSGLFGFAIGAVLGGAAGAVLGG